MLPRLRINLDFMPSPVPDKPGLLIRDPFQYSDATLIIPPALVAGLEFFDGRHGEPDLREFLVRLTGDLQVGELENHLIDVIAPDERQLLAELDGREIKRFDGRTEVLHTRDAEIVEYRPTSRERIVSAVADPNVGFILLALGALGIYVEFSAPGLIFPGVLGGIMALLGLSSLAVLPINWIGAALLILGGAFFILEAKFTSHGVLGLGGTISTAQACEAAGGRFFPQIFGWMVHVYPFESSPEKMWEQ